MDVGIFVGAGAAILAACIGVVGTLWARRRRSAKLELVDVSHTATSRRAMGAEEDSALVRLTSSEVNWIKGPVLIPTLDIKVRNSGGQSAFIKRAVLDISEAGILPTVGFLGPALRFKRVPASWEYDVDLPLPLRGVPFQSRVDISQMVLADDVDRFQIRLRAQASFEILYRMRLRLIYNEGDREVVSQPLIIILPAAPTHIESSDDIYRYVRAFRRTAADVVVRKEHVQDPDYDDYYHTRDAIRRYLGEIENRLTVLVQFATRPGLCDPELSKAVDKAALTLRNMDRIRAAMLESVAESPSNLDQT